ncbi:hypothetical protein Hte_006587 [Hypoxylon texense]
MRQYSYEFCPLGDLSKDIRVLEIIDNTSDPIDCNLVKNPPGKPYTTLSWCWGMQGQEYTEIRIIDENQPYEFKVPKSLESAIRMLRQHKKSRIWIDYICIDQLSVNEKNHQVPMMSHIYGEAERVFVWLGDEGEESRVAMEFVENRVLNLRDFDRLIRDENAVREWRALSALMKRQWFSRRWIVQEIAIAQNATLLCGPHKVEWRDFADAVSLFNEVEKSTRKISEVMKFNRELGHIPDFFGDVSELSATKLVEETNNLFRRLTSKDREAQFSLEYLVSKLTAFKSSEPRDAIYALVAIARDTRPVTTQFENSVIQSWTYPEYIKQKLINQLARQSVSKPYHVDYAIPLSDVYAQFVKWTIDKSEKTRALDIICRPWAPEPPPPESTSRDDSGDEEEEEDDEEDPHCHFRIKTNMNRPEGEGTDTLPSWIPTVDRAAFGMDGTGQKMTRKNADSLVGLPPRRIYRAAGTRVLTDNFRMEDGITYHNLDERLNGLHYHSIFVEGFVLDTVRTLKDPSQQGNIPKDWLALARDKHGQLRDEFWRTIVADRSPAGENAPRYYPRLVDHAVRQGVPGDALNTKDLVNWGNCTIVGEVLRRVQSSIWNRKLMRTKADRRLGLAPELASSSDLICILYGCSVPVLLRKFTKTPEEVRDEDRQRQEKQEKLEEKRRVEAAKTIWRTWGYFTARRRANGRLPPRSSAVRAGSVMNSPIQRSDDLNLNTDKKPLKSEPDVYYQLIGECYVDGMMNGEALMRSHQSMLFEIR